MIHQNLLRRAVEGRDASLVEFVETLAPAILVKFATTPALGGSGKVLDIRDPCLPSDLTRYSSEELKKFSQMNDQSMVTHIFNGIFAGMRLIEKLPASKELSTLEKKLWLLGYIIHDYTKIYGIKVEASNLLLIRQAIICLGDELNFSSYLPTWKDSLDDITFLGQNTQTVDGVNLNINDFPNLNTPQRRLLVMRLVSSIADILVHITSPADVAERGIDDRDRASNIHDKLNILFGVDHSPRLVYHRLTEVRGLITNLINNSIMTILKDQGYEPFLLFPNGIVYLVDQRVKAKIDADELSDSVWTNFINIVNNSDTFGVRRAGTGFIPSSALLELTGLAGVFHVGRRKAMHIVASHATSRIYGFITGESVNDLMKRVGELESIHLIQSDLVNSKGLVDDVRVDRLAEFLTFVYRVIRDNYKKAPDTTPILLKTLGLEREVTLEEATRQKGGTYFGWFYVSSMFIQRNSGIDDLELENIMIRIINRMLAWVEEVGVASKESAIGDSIKDYVTKHVEIDSRLISEKDAYDVFINEFNRYTESKSKRRPVCSLCSSQYISVLQESTEIPFINQQYSNKNQLAGNTVIRGICPICRVEMILRRVQQPEFTEKNKPIQLYIYPTYFFTLETAQVVKLYLNEAQDLNLYSLLKHLRKNGFTIANIINYDGFCGGDNEGHSYSIIRPFYSETDESGMFSFPLRSLANKPTDTDSWILPTLYALALPLILNVKVVASSSFLPIFNTGVEFVETVLLDAPHSFTRYILGNDRFRVDETGYYLIRLLELYDLNIDVFAEPKNFHWPQINMVAKDIVSDPYYVFAYYDRKKRSKKQPSEAKRGGNIITGKGIPEWDLNRYIEIYRIIGGEIKMGFIGKIVDAYAVFYKPDFGKMDSAYAVLRPLMTAIETTIESDPQTELCDLILLIAGAVNDDQERIRNGQAEGFDPIVTNKEFGSYPERIALSRKKIDEFARLFLEEVFEKYCSADRAILQERTNRIRSAARFYFLQNHAFIKKGD